MKNGRLLVTARSLLLLCSMTFAQQVSANYNHNANFSQYHTHAWGSNNKNAIQNSILAQVAQQDIEAAMQQKGLQKGRGVAKPRPHPHCQRRRAGADLL